MPHEKENTVQYGDNRLISLADELGVGLHDLLVCLSEINKLEAFYNWVNADDYLQTRLSGIEKKDKGGVTLDGMKL